MNKIRISTQATLIGIITLVGFMISGWFYNDSNEKLGHYRQLQALATEKTQIAESIKYGFLNARRNEKDFLVRNSEKYLEKHKKTSATVYQNLSSLENILTDQKSLDLVHNVRNGYQVYQKHFSNIAILTIEIGLNEKEGLRGQLRQAVHKIEAILKTAQEADLTVSMLMMRRHEKDFLLRNNPKYIDRMKLRHTEFLQYLSASQLPVEQKEEITQLMMSYHQQFTKLAQKRLVQTDAIAQLSQIFKEASPHLNALTEESLKKFNTASSQSEKTAQESYLFIASTMSSIALIVVFLALTIGRGISKPINRMCHTMKDLANNKLDVRVPYLNHENEIGDMANAVQTFKENALHLNKMEADKKEQEQRAKEERQVIFNQLADNFEQSVLGVVTAVASASNQVHMNAKTLSRSADEAGQKSNEIENAAGHASANVQTVAAAAEELAHSINEISRQSVQATKETTQAVEIVRNTKSNVSELMDAVGDVSNVLNIIKEIADQTNMLALNATIEAARAGNHGKGFAVVASEVKDLANQTGKATGEITQLIQNIQEVTQNTVQDIDNVEYSICQIDGVSSAISAAVEEQDAATKEIARNIEEAANGTEDVTQNISEVRDAAQMTTQESSSVLHVATELFKHADQLKERVSSFMKQVRTV